MKIERTKNAVRNIKSGIILKLYQMLVPFLMRTLMIYHLGVQYLGLNSLFSSVLQVLNLAELGVGSAMVYSMYKPIADDDSTTICALMKLYRTYYRIIGLVIAVVGALITPFIPRLIAGDVPSDINIYILYLLNLGATVLSYWLFSYKNSILQAHQRTDIANKVLMLTSTIQYVLQIIVLLVFKNYYYYLIVALGTQVLTNIVTALAADKLYPQYQPKGNINPDAVKQINQKIKDLFTTKIGTIVVASADTIVISAFMGLTDLAIYQNYYFIMNAVSAFIMIMFSSILAGVGNSLVTETKEKNYQDFNLLTFMACWLLCVCTCCFAGLYQPFIELWVGRELLLPFGCMLLFCVFFYIHQLSMVWATMKDAAGIWHEDRFRQLIAAAVNLTLNITLVNCIGMYGILLSTIMSYLIVSMPWLLRNLFSLLYQRSAMGYLKRLSSYVAVALVSCALVSIVCEQLVLMDGILGLLIRGVICVVIPNLLLMIFFRRTDEYGKVLMLAKKTLKPGN